MTRKFLSMSSLGLVDYRSDRERAARSARLTKRAIKTQTREVRRAGHRESELLSEVRDAALGRYPGQAQPAPLMPVGPPPGWYPDQTQAGWMRWWNGVAWTEHVTRSTS